MATYDKFKFDAVFGADSIGDTPEERAATSTKRYVRGQDEIAEDSDAATGYKMSAKEALETFGFDILFEAVDDGSAIIVCDHDEPMASLKQRRLALNLTTYEVAERAKVKIIEVVKAEDPRYRSSIHVLRKMAVVLGLNPGTIGFKKMDLVKNGGN
ncbi:MAG: helix-turn-helix transcriptional regulator [Candidatus Vogelbacteria bacterium]|nr:helix-turn-helix transcriptional regulator [Candidatus Vogelbacteria bacterium]